MTLLLAATLVGPLGTSSALARDFRLYAGHLSDGGPIAARIFRGHQGTLRLRAIDFEVVFTCEDTSTQHWGIGFGFYPGLALPDRVLSLDSVDPDLALHINGTFGPRHASGDLSATIPALTEDEQAQLCTTGDLTWTMRHRRPSGTSAPSPRLDGRIRVVIGPSGTEPIVHARTA